MPQPDEQDPPGDGLGVASPSSQDLYYAERLKRMRESEREDLIAQRRRNVPLDPPDSAEPDHD